MIRSLSRAAVLAVFASALPLTACRSYHVDATVRNDTGTPLQELEVDYPSASFGVNSLAPGADFHYRFQIRGSGQVTVQYQAGERHNIQIKGPALQERQEGSLEIILLPNGKGEFHPQLTAPR